MFGRDFINIINSSKNFAGTFKVTSSFTLAQYLLLYCTYCIILYYVVRNVLKYYEMFYSSDTYDEMSNA